MKLEDRYKDIWRKAREGLSTSSHGVSHTKRVFRLAKELSDDDVEDEILLPAALLHDIARAKEDEDETGEVDHAILGAEKADRILKKVGYGEEKIEKIKHCIETHRFRSDRKPKSKEAKILSDADKLDAIGAVGVARAYMLAGEYEEELYRDVDLKTYEDSNLKDSGKVKDIQEHAPNLEYEMKLKKIASDLHTRKAKKIADKRQRFMETFFERLEKEIEGKK
ncbi:MAG: HD domain-containing protein [Candidatus Thermoplasmatota archaeon]